MKKILIGALLALTAVAHAATMVPSTLINWISVPTWPSVSAGTVFAGPAAASGAPTFRALVASDLPVVTVAKGGTGCTAAAGACLDNITGFSGTGFIKRTGAGAYTFVADPLPVSNGGTSATTASGARSALGAAASGANTDITSLSAPALGAATATTATAGDNTTKVATTAYVQTTVAGGSNAASFTTINASGLITPSSTAGIKGTATNDDAAAGSVGEFPSPTNLSGVALTSGSVANVSSMSLTAGDWDIQCVAQFTPNSTTNTSTYGAGISVTSGAYEGLGTYAAIVGASWPGTSGAPALVTPIVRKKFASTTTVYCVASSSFSGSTMTASGSMRARRPR
ncbi:hypothetical protein [Burkholderia vietnamiensis]|uniref:hypothetical protein n=1 Tax=Burkholderia vietnamiensis TaxID=60552 RepID=UPI001B97ED4E|nr:hypothetical protein [Burkholderia vietnamiensis]MBR8201702.1 hypothetical protein [Burkholderia vietnamiensis]